MRRRAGPELAGAEERRQRDIAETKDGGASRSWRRPTRAAARQLQARDEEQHTRVTDLERRHLTEEDGADRAAPRRIRPGAGARLARAEGELAARVQEIQQAYRAAVRAGSRPRRPRRAEPGSCRPAMCGWHRRAIRIAELEAKAAHDEDQIARVFQRIRADDKTTEKTRRGAGRPRSRCSMSARTRRRRRPPRLPTSPAQASTCSDR